MAMLDGLQFIHTSRPLLRPGIDGIAHADLSVHATVEAVVPHRLGHQQDGDRQQAQGADGSQNRDGVGTHHLPGCQGLVVVVRHTWMVSPN